MNSLIPHQTEAQFQKAVIELAQLSGWLVAHFRVARMMRGEDVVWRTPVEADGAGFPDLVLVRERTLFRELKSNRGIVRPEQQMWIERLQIAGADIAIWRPDDWSEIVKTLQSKQTRRT